MVKKEAGPKDGSRLVEVGLCSAFWSLTLIFGAGGVLTPKLEITLTHELGVG